MVKRSGEPEAGGFRTWVVRFDPAGISLPEIRMLQELIEGNVGLARLAFCAELSGERAERRIAESVCEALAADFPHVIFRVEPV
jgi:hypothetical protein